MTDLFKMFRDSIDFAMGITYVEVWGISVFEVALLSFLAYSLFRFIINPLFSSSFPWDSMSDSASDSEKNIKSANQIFMERSILDYWRR